MKHPIHKVRNAKKGYCYPKSLSVLSTQSKKLFHKPEELCSRTRMQTSHEGAGHQWERVWEAHSQALQPVCKWHWLYCTYTQMCYRSFLKPLASKDPR